MKTLFISDIYPSKKSLQNLMVLSFCKIFRREMLVGYVFSKKCGNDAKVNLFEQEKFQYFKADSIDETSLRLRRLPGKLRFLSSIGREWFRKHIQVPIYARHILKYSNENQIERHWIVLNGQTTLWIAEYLLRKGKLPIFIQAFGSPQSWGSENRFDRFSAKMVKKSFNFCIQNSSWFSTCSQELAAQYERNHGKKVWFTPARTFEKPELRQITSRHQNSDKLVIGIGGDIGAAPVFRTLVDALDSVYWEIGGRKVEVHYWGRQDLTVSRSRIIFRDACDCSNLPAQLSSCDLLYFPEWFDRNWARGESALGTSQLDAYMCSGSAIFLHVPEHSSLSSKFPNSSSMIVCRSVDIEVIKMNLRKVLSVDSSAESKSGIDFKQDRFSGMEAKEQFKYFIHNL